MGAAVTVVEKALIDVSDPAERTALAAAGRVAPADLHSLRLCLDLQVDSLLYAVRAAAASAVNDQDGGATRSGSVPEAPGSLWSRWLSEDLELVFRLYATALATEEGSSSALADRVDDGNGLGALDDLLARYWSMRSMLSDLVGRAGVDVQAWGGALRSALRHCDQRIEELERYRTGAIVNRTVANTPPQGVPRPGRSLPGGYLG